MGKYADSVEMGSYLMRAKSSSVLTYKIAMAVTGVVLLGFLLGHVVAVSLLYLGPDTINGYAKGLREVPALLWGARGVLFLSVCLHIYTAIKLTAINREACGVAPRRLRPQKAKLSSQTMMLSGLVILAFVLYHLAHLTFRWTHAEEFAHLGDFDAYSMMVISFKSPWVTGFYLLAVLLLVAHLQHGVVSFFQTLGVGGKNISAKISKFGPILSLIVCLGFAAVPLSIFLGLVE